MFFPILKGHSGKKVEISGFGGLNLSQMTKIGELSDMKNMTSDKIPHLCPSAKKDTVEINTNIKNIQAVIAPCDDESEACGFTGVADGVFYYQDSAKTLAYDFMEIPTDSPIQLVSYGDLIIIAPMMYYYNFKDPNKKTEVYPLTPGVYDEPIHVDTTDDAGKPIILKLMGENVTWQEYGFEVGDSIILRTDEALYQYLNVYIPENKYDKVTSHKIPLYAIVQSISEYTMKVNMYDRDNDIMAIEDTKANLIDYEFNRTLRVYKRYPEFSNICVYANRLWATTKDGASVYASVPGEPSEFSDFDGLSTDSWYTDVGEQGGFTGITSFRDGVIAFKESNMYHIYGDRPTNFNIAKQFSNCGCIDFRSICETDTAVYFLGSDGVYEYSGGTPVNISQKLSLKKCSEGTAFCDGKKYYLSCNAEEKVYAYSRDYGMWHIEGDFSIVGGVKFKGEAFLASKTALLKLSGTFENDWYAVLCDITENDMSQKGINDIFIRAENGENSEIKVWVSVNGGEFELFGGTRFPGEYTFRIPVRFKKGDKYSIKISGKGSAVIKGIERSFYIGGGAFTRKG